MALYPIELNLEATDVLVVGGGAVAARKVESLVRAGARVRVISTAFAPELQRRHDIQTHCGPYAPDAIGAARLVFACTDDRDVNAQVAADARAAGRWCNVADDAEGSDFFVPAVLRRGSFTVAVGTAGAGPHLAARIRDGLVSQFGPEFGMLVDELQRARPIVRARIGDLQIRRRLLATLAGEPSVELLVSQGLIAWRAWFEQRLQEAESGRQP